MINKYVPLYECICIYCMKGFKSFNPNAEICPECIIEQDKAYREIVEGDDWC